MSIQNDRLVVPVESEFVDNLQTMFGAGLFGDIKQRMIPLALEIIRMSLLGHIHPFETLRGLSDHQWEDLLENPYTPSLINKVLQELETNPKLADLIETMNSPVVLQRLRVEWLHEITVGRFERTVPYLYREEELVQQWKVYCDKLQDLSFPLYETCEQTGLKALQMRGAGFSENAKKLFMLSFMSACRKLFVYFSESKETWVSAYTLESFKLPAAMVDLVSSRGQRVDRLSLKFGLVDNVFTMKPNLEQATRFLECVKQVDVVFAIQQKLCPFVTLAGTGLNFNLMADVFYRVYLPQRIRELKNQAEEEHDIDFSEKSGIPQSLVVQLGFLQLRSDTVDFYESKINNLPRLSPFLHNPRTERGLVRQRLYRGIVDQILTTVTQDTLLALCRQWNPLIRTSETATIALMDYAESYSWASAAKMTGAQDHARRRAIMDILLNYLIQNTQHWQKALERDSFVVDKARGYFMTILDRAIEEQGSEDMRMTRHRDTFRVVSVVSE